MNRLWTSNEKQRWSKERGYKIELKLVINLKLAIQLVIVKIIFYNRHWNSFGRLDQASGLWSNLRILILEDNDLINDDDHRFVASQVAYLKWCPNNRNTSKTFDERKLSQECMNKMERWINEILRLKTGSSEQSIWCLKNWWRSSQLAKEFRNFDFRGACVFD